MSVYARVGLRSVLDWNLKDTLLQFIRFGLVGGINTFIDIMFFNILVWIFPTNSVYLLVLYNSLAYITGAVNSFCWNKLWTFKHRSRVTSKQVVRFALVT